MQGFTEITVDGEWETFSYTGNIDENSEEILTPYLKSLGQNVIINFGNVDKINSCGVLHWINFIGALCASRQVRYEKCTPDIIQQINMIPRFTNTAEIVSVYARYVCTHCGHEQMYLFVKGKNLPLAAQDGVSEVACSKCRKITSFQEVEEDYFAFVDR